MAKPGLTIGRLCSVNMKSQKAKGRLNRVPNKREIKTRRPGT